MHQGSDQGTYQGGYRSSYQGGHQITATQRFAGERIVSSGEKTVLVKMQPHRFDLKIEINLGSPHVYISDKALLDMSCIVSEATMGEVGWVGTVRRDGMNFYIDEIFLPEQRGHHSTCEITTEGLGNLSVEILQREDGVDVWNSLRFWGHVHPGSDTSPSGQDNDQMKIFSESCTDFFVRGILGRSGRMEFTIFLYDIGVVFYDVEWSVKEEDEELAKRRGTWRDLLAKVVKPIVHVVAGRKSSGRRGKQRGRTVVAKDDDTQVVENVEEVTGEDDGASSARDWKEEMALQRTSTDEVPDESDPGAGAHFDPDAESSVEMDQEEITATFDYLEGEIERGSALRIIKWVNGVEAPLGQDDVDPREYGDSKLRDLMEDTDCPSFVVDEFSLRKNQVALDHLIAKTVQSVIRGGPCIEISDSTAHFDCCCQLDELLDRALVLHGKKPEDAPVIREAVLADLRELLEKRGYENFVEELVSNGYFFQREGDNATQPAESVIDEVAAT